jgi:exosortase A-associated hydrolase 1
MKPYEEGLVFDCAGETLVGVLTRADAGAEAGMVVIVGGPQYRAGSHRQFVLLCRRVAAAGFPALRFDYRGMGDSGGAPVGFENADADVGAAIDALIARCPTIRRVYLWGLCDGASAALIYVQRTADPRVKGVCILNPWVRTAATLARAQVKHYYGQRLLQRGFWTKLVSGGVDVGGALRELALKLRSSRSASRIEGAGQMTFQTRMARALRGFSGRVLLVTSGRDLTAREFLEYVAADAEWAGLVGGAGLRRVDLPDADHTFSSAAWRAEVEEATIAWLRSTADGVA